MRILGPKTPETTKVSREASDQKASESETSKGAERARGEKVQISKQAQQLTDMRAPEKPDLERVERLRQAIESGDFKVDAEKIAERMMEEEL